MPRRKIAAPILLATLLSIACGAGEEPAPRAPDPGPAAEEKPKPAEISTRLADAPEIVRTEVLRTCDKWRHRTLECDDEAVRRDQLQCWAEVGGPTLRRLTRRGLRPRALARATMLHHNVCMERRDWRFREFTGSF